MDVGDLNIRFIDGEAIDRSFEALEVNKDNDADYLRIVKGAPFQEKVKIDYPNKVDACFSQ